MQTSQMPVRVGSNRARARRRTFLKEWRENLNLTLEKAAERFDMSAAQLSRIERGKSDMTLGFLDMAAKAYGTTIASLLDHRPGEVQEAEAQIAEIAKIITQRKTGT